MNFSLESVLKDGQIMLKKAGIENYANEAKEIIENLLDKTPEEVFLIKDTLIDNKIRRNFLKKIKRRCNGEPLQYITKIAHFYSRAINISKGVLIPRPETEILIEKVLKTLKLKKNMSCLDMCAGSGCIGLTLMLENQNFKNVVFVDKSKMAMDCCRHNVKKFKTLSKSDFILSDFYSKVKKKKYDVVCCNPPYISSQEYISLQRTVKDYEPRSALISKNNGYLHIERIAKDSIEYLKKDSYIFFEVGVGQASKVRKILSNLGYTDLVTYNDLGNIERVVSGKWKK